MSSAPDYKVRELFHARPKLRPDLRFTLQEFHGQACYLLEDPVRGRFFRVGMREYTFLQRLDGSEPLGRLVAQTAATSREHAFTEQEAISVVRWLSDAELLVSADAGQANRLFHELQHERQPERFLQKSNNILFLRWPLGNPDRLIAWALRWLGWMLRWPFFLVWLAVVVWGALSVGQNWTRFSEETHRLVTGGEWLLPILVWLVLKLVHELWHGLVCKRYGGNVPEAGIILLLFTTPLAYVDASSSIRFRSKWQRMAVASAGVYIELFIAAVAGIVWAGTEPGPLASAAQQAVLLGSVVTLLFNGNPLMRFDGYYLLSDWLEIPNLYSRGQACMACLVQRYLLGRKRMERPVEPGQSFTILAAYGMASAVWRGVVFLGIFFAAAFLLHGAGLLLALVVGVGALIQWIRHVISGIRAAARAEHRSIFAILTRPALVLACVAGLLFVLRVQESAKAPAVVELNAKSVVRADCPGFVRRVLVKPGQSVRAGDLLLTMDNPAQRGLLAQLRLDLERSQLRSRIYHREENVAAFQAELENSAALQVRIREMERYVATLDVTAPRTGTVYARQLENLPGTYLSTGTEILVVAEPAAFKLTVAIPQESIELFRQNAGHQVAVAFEGHFRSVQAPLARVEAGVSREVAHAALAAMSGGPLPVELRNQQDPETRGTRTLSGGTPLHAWQLTQPHCYATVVLPAGAGARLHEGEMAVVKAFSSESRSLAAIGRDFVRRMFDRKLESLQLVVR